MKIVNVKNFEGLYAVTEEGVVYSLTKGKVQNPYIDKDGYCRVELYKHGKAHQLPLQRVVFGSFHRKVNIDDITIDHIDHDKLNNKLDNLRLLSRRENSMDARHRSKHLKGVNYASRLNKYISTISIEGKRYYLGLFNTEKNAHEAYLNALDSYNKSGVKPFHKDDIPEGYKKCTHCGEIKPISEFCKQGKSFSGKCKPCLHEYNRERRKALSKLQKEIDE